LPHGIPVDALNLLSMARQLPTLASYILASWLPMDYLNVLWLLLLASALCQRLHSFDRSLLARCQQLSKMLRSSLMNRWRQVTLKLHFAQALEIFSNPSLSLIGTTGLAMERFHLPSHWFSVPMTGL
jgi:hypothetical protein